MQHLGGAFENNFCLMGQEFEQTIFKSSNAQGFVRKGGGDGEMLELQIDRCIIFI